MANEDEPLGIEDLFSELPDPEKSTPQTQPALPGSRRARREAAEAGEAAEAAAPSVAEQLVSREKEEKRRRPKRKKRWLAWTLVLVVVLGGIAGGGGYIWSVYGDRVKDMLGWTDPTDYEDGIAEGEALVTIYSDFTGIDVSHALHDAGVTMTAGGFYDYLIQEQINPTFYPGVYTLQQKMSSRAALEALEDPANKMEGSVYVPEGVTLEYLIPIVSDAAGIEAEEFEAAVADPSAYGVEADTLEGWLFPATYEFTPGTTAEEMVGTMVQLTRDVMAELGVEEGDEHRVLTIAAIIQREGRLDDFSKVSRVIYNRLEPNSETNGLLQMDSTAQYGVGQLHQGSAGSSAEALEDDNPYNTYIHPGLPAGPISTVTKAAIDAALNPADGPWLYFVTVNLDTGETLFSATYAEQLENEKKWHDWCRENPDSGCYAG